MVKTSSKLSKVLSMLIVLSMVLSSMAFTLPVSAAGTDLFFEDFNSTEFNSSTGTVDTTVVSKATLDGTTVDGTTVTWQAAADGTAETNETGNSTIKFEDDVLKMNRGTANDDGSQETATAVTIKTGMADDKTSSGYIVFETDFKATSIPKKTKWNEYEGEIRFLEQNKTKVIARLSIGQTNGLQDLVGSTTNATTYAAADANAANGVNYKDNMGTAEDLENKDIKFRVVYDLKNDKSLSTAIVDGETGARVSSLGWHTVGAGGWKKITTITLGAPVTGGSSPANYQFDNIKLTKYRAADALSLTNSTVAANKNDVALSGAIDLTFSDDIDAGSISGIKLKESDGTLITPDSVTMNGTNGVTIAYSDLDASTAYSITTNDVVLSKDTGLPVVDDEITFTTIAAAVTPDPVTVSSTSALTNVAIDANFVVTFSKAINDTTLEGITVMAGATPVAFATSVEGEVLTINPDADLAYETTYTLTLPNTITATDNGAFAGAEYEFTTVEEPEVIIPAPTATITPANNATGVAIDTDIVIEFSKEMNEGTLANIKVMNGATEVPYIPSLIGNVLTITPENNWANGTTYEVVIPATVLAADGGVFVAETYTFTTVQGAVIPDPVTATIVPADEATDVAIDADIVVTFGRAINDATLAGITVKAGAADVAFATSLAGNVLTINPDADLAYNTEYTVTLPATIAAADGGVFAGLTSTFTTEEEVIVIPDPVTATIVPANAATDVAVGANIVITFSRAVNEATLAGITVKAGATDVAFATSLAGNVLTINPNADLVNSTTYTVTVPATVVAADGGAFAGLTSTFTTVAVVLPEPEPTPSEGNLLWSQNFDAISALSGDALDAYMAENYSGWSAQIGTAPTKYTYTNYLLGTGFKWSEGMTKYVTADNKGGLVGFANSRVKLGVPSYMGQGSTETKVTIPVSIADMTDVNYAVFEFDYYSDKIAKRGGNQYFNDGNVLLQNASGKNIARISIGTTWGIQDLADLATLDATTIGAAANNLGTASSALHGKTIHFAVVFDMDNDKYTIAVTPEGGETTTRMNGSTPWISLPEGVTADSFAKIVLSEKDYLNSSGISLSEYDNFKITGYEALPSVVLSSIANDATGIPTDGLIVLTFSDEIDANTIGGITLKQGETPIEIAPVVDGATVTVPYDALAGFTAYTLTVPVTVSSVDGLPIVEQKVITFTTGERIAPTPVVSEIVPAADAPEVSINSDVVITFSVPMNVETLEGILIKNQAGEAIGYTYEMSNNDKVMTITPDEALAVLSDYTVVIPVSVISAENKPLAEEVTATFTTADYPLTTGSVLWEQNFDDVTSSNVPENWKGTIVVPNPENGNVTVSYSTSTNMTWADAATAYAGKIAFEGGKLQIGEKGNTEHGGAGATIEIPVELESAHPTTGYTVFEYDYYSDAMATRNRFNEWEYHDITLGGAKTIYMADVTTTTGIQTLLGVEYSSNATDYTGKIAGTYKDNIRSGAGLSGKTVHFQVVFDLDGLQYKIFAIVDGVVSTLSDEWTALPAGVSVENFVSTLRICQQDSNTGSSTFTMAQYDNFKYTAYDVLPQAMGASTDGLTSVAIDSEIVVTFNGVLAELDTDSITFTADGEEVEFTAEIVGEGNKIKITPAEDLPYSAICEIKFADNMTTEDGYIMSGSTIEFITEPKPVSFVQTGITFKDEAGNTITSIGASTEVHVEGVFENTTDKVQNITKIIVAYDASGKKLKSAFVTETIAANGSKTVNLDLDIDGLGATTIKVFAIDSFANLTPMISTEVLN